VKRGGKRLVRSVGGTQARRRLLVFTEGEQTETSYLLAWSRVLRHLVEVEISPDHGAPQTLVALARNAKVGSDREFKRGRGRQYDEFWCVFDVDEHPGLDEALRQATVAGISVAVTNPCIELWFLLHWVDQTAYTHRHDVQRAAAQYIGTGKRLDPTAAVALIKRYEFARERACELDRMHALNGSPAGSNPSSSVWRLIDSLRGEIVIAERNRADGGLGF
jgi:RloB-like protein